MTFLCDNNLLGQLVHETFEEQTGAQEMLSYEVFYYSSIQCYQMTIEKKTYTFPSNWGPFVDVKSHEGEGIILENDLESFNSIFGSLIGKDIKTAFVFKGDETYIIFVPKKMEINLSDLHSLINDHSSFKLAA